MDWTFILNLAWPVVVLLLGLIANNLVGEFLKEKGKNYATKQDIEEVTLREENARKQVTFEIETLRSQFARQEYTRKLAFDKEFDLLSKLWIAFTELFRIAFPLGVMIDPQVLSREAVQRIEGHEHVHEQFEKCFFAFTKVYEENRPFYPQTIYEILDEFARVTSFYNKITRKPLESREQVAQISQLLDKKLAQMDSINQKLCIAIRKELISPS